MTVCRTLCWRPWRPIPVCGMAAICGGGCSPLPVVKRWIACGVGPGTRIWCPCRTGRSRRRRTPGLHQSKLLPTSWQGTTRTMRPAVTIKAALTLDGQYLRAVWELCGERDVLLIADDVQAGMGRTGHWFSWQEFGFRSDIATHRCVPFVI